MHFPVLLKLGPINVYSYGFFVALAFVVGGVFIYWQTKKKRLPFSKLLNFSPWIVIGVMIGARIYYVLQHFSYYRNHLLEVFAFWNGGLSMYGGVIAGLLLLLLFLRRQSPRERWLWLDVVIMSVLLGSAIGRIGCFLNGCCYGLPLKLSWGVTSGLLGDGIERHPTQLYESLGYLLSFFVTFFVYQKIGRKLTIGTIFFGGVVLHSLTRFIVELFRFSDSYLGPFKTAHLVTFSIIVVAITIYLVTYKSRLKLSLKGA